MTDDSLMYHDGNRRLQDAFESRPIADRLEQRLMRTAFTADDKDQIERSIYFFLATADAAGRPGGGSRRCRSIERKHGRKRRTRNLAPVLKPSWRLKRANPRHRDSRRRPRGGAARPGAAAW